MTIETERGDEADRAADATPAQADAADEMASGGDGASQDHQDDGSPSDKPRRAGPRRAGPRSTGASDVPVIPPKNRPARRSTSSRTASTARPAGSAVPADDAPSPDEVPEASTPSAAEPQVSETSRSGSGSGRGGGGKKKASGRPPRRVSVAPRPVEVLETGDGAHGDHPAPSDDVVELPGPPEPPELDVVEDRAPREAHGADGGEAAEAHDGARSGGGAASDAAIQGAPEREPLAKRIPAAAAASSAVEDDLPEGEQDAGWEMPGLDASQAPSHKPERSKRSDRDSEPQPAGGPAPEEFQDAQAVAVAAPSDDDLGPLRPDFVRMVVDGVPMSDGGPTTRVVPALSAEAPPRRAGGRPKPVADSLAVPEVTPDSEPVPVGGAAGPVVVPLGPKAAPAQPSRPSGPRRVKVQLSQVSPWSVMKLGFLLSVGMGIAFVVAVYVIWNVLDRVHLFVDINDQIAEIVGPESAANFDLLQYVELGKVMAAATGVAVINVVLTTVLATLGSLLYNVTSALVGGVHVTLRDD